MRYPEGHKEEVRARIVAEAARAVRREGLGAVSIPALMKRAGLTHGGFYVHFNFAVYYPKTANLSCGLGGLLGF